MFRKLSVLGLMHSLDVVLRCYHKEKAGISDIRDLTDCHCLLHGQLMTIDVSELEEFLQEWDNLWLEFIQYDCRIPISHFNFPILYFIQEVTVKKLGHGLLDIFEIIEAARMGYNVTKGKVPVCDSEQRVKPERYLLQVCTSFTERIPSVNQVTNQQPKVTLYAPDYGNGEMAHNFVSILRFNAPPLLDINESVNERTKALQGLLPSRESSKSLLPFQNFGYVYWPCHALLTCCFEAW